MSLCIIAATNRQNSNTLRVATYFYERLKKRNPYLLDLQQFQPLIRPDIYQSYDPVLMQWAMPVKTHQQLLFVVPEYNGSIPGILKLFIDLLPREYFKEKTCFLVGISDGKFGNLRGLDHFTNVLHYIGCFVHPYRIHIPNISTCLAEDGLNKIPLKEEIQNFIALLSK